MNTRSRPHPARVHDIRLLLLAAALMGLLWPAVVQAGGGPENVALVINADSWASRTIANEYIHLRNIPPGNVIVLPGVGLDTITVDRFRAEILKPAFETIEQRGLAGQIDYLVYSADFPYAIDATGDLKEVELPAILGPTASLTGLTCLYQAVLAKSSEYVRLDSNRYARRTLPLSAHRQLPPAAQKEAERAAQLIQQQDWTTAAELYADLAARYAYAAVLHYNHACCLARTDRPDQALDALGRAVQAGWLDAEHTARDEDLASLRQDQRFGALLERIRNTIVEVQPTLGFRAPYSWDGIGRIVPQGGRRYLLSTMLGVTSGRGNSVTEVLACLRRSTAADGTRPTGTVYFALNSDVRSRVRAPLFASAVAALQELNVAARIVPGQLPEGCADVQGAMLGSATFDWPGSRSHIQPGAICEHLTSTGGVLRERAQQTPLTELIRYGAAGASGTVTEPFAIAAKFPSPFLHVHYARGCSLAEAFYQSVAGPYQLLIVGDPLCQPWARLPEVAVDGIEPNATMRGELALRPHVTNETQAPIGHFALYVDGRRRAACRPNEALTIDKDTLADGYHELRVVGVVTDQIQTQGRVILPIHVDNHGHKLVFSHTGGAAVPWEKPLKVRARLPGAERITIFHNAQALATIAGAQGSAELDPRQLGLGPVRLFAVGYVGTPAVEVFGDPLDLVVEMRDYLPAAQPRRAASELVEGLALTLDDNAPVVVTETHERGWLGAAGAQPGQRFALHAYFDVPADDVYQFQLHSNVRPTILVDGHELEQPDTKPWKHIPLALRAGRHKLHVHGKLPDKPGLTLRFGGPGTYSVGAPRFLHVRLPQETQPSKARQIDQP
ncbi:MAG: hypothetical protein KKB50_21545 [Planctomycetes bacterium]|nr:hypothetical protein [Planctomycetota bacterium]